MGPISSQVHKIATISPTRPAIVSNESTTTYSELSRSMERVCSAFHPYAEQENCVVAVVANKKHSTVHVLLGALHSGLIVVPINPLLKPKQILHILNDSEATVLVCDQYNLDAIKSNSCLPKRVQCIVIADDSSDIEEPAKAAYISSKIDSANNNFSRTVEYNWQQFLDISNHVSATTPAPVELDQPAVILYTSGSTGQPKGVVFTHSNLLYGASSISEYLGNRSSDRILALMPLSFDYGLSQLTSAIYTGATLVLYDYFVPSGVIDAVVKHKITAVPAVPHVWNSLASLNWPNLEHLRYITSTGGRLQESTIRKLEQALPTTSIYSMYGFTEAFRATYLPPDQLRIRPNSIGKSVPHAQVLVVDSDGNELPPGKIGELVQSGPLVSDGYWKDKPATRMKFRPLKKSKDESPTIFAWSGDRAYRDEDGYIYFVSRIDDQIKLNGYRLSTTEIEYTISESCMVKDVCVVSIDNGDSNQIAVGFVTLNDGCELDSLTQWCKQQMPGYMVPNQFFVLDTLPLNPNRKVDKHALLALYNVSLEAQDNL